MKKLICGIGSSEIRDHEILISDYPFEPSIAYPEQKILADEIDSICADIGMCMLYTAGDIVLVSAVHKEAMKAFAKRNDILLVKSSQNWDRILEPFLDADFSDEAEKKTLKLLSEVGLHKSEVSQIRMEVGPQMWMYNIDSGLLDWFNLSISDVLAAMRVKYDTETFRDFYKRALEIYQRGS